MRKRMFGNSGLETSVIGYGGWPMGRGMYGDFDDDEAIRAARASYEEGVTLFDTAAVYGWGYGENLMGKALKGIRENVVLVTKGAREWVRDNPDRRSATVSDSDPKRLLTSIDESLKRLQTDYIDLFLIHWPDHNRAFSEPMDALEKAKAAGKIRYTGVSNFSVEMMAESRDSSPIVTNQIGYHIFDRRPEAEVMPFVKENGMGIMAYGSLSHGLLTGTWDADKTFSEDDWRRGGANFGINSWGPENLAANVAVVEKLKVIAADHGKTIPQLAIAWVLANDTVSVALAGSVTPGEATDNIGGDWEMSPELKNEIDDLVISEGSGVGMPGMEIAT
ncbi:MAG: aldo/keto reductase [SAR202 cluster bacterium]|jgi:aryl-alcohol dehydrogenase-like predicted oxidoreductase|nr:MAG: aldo/keto reductase [SAR202 cluster bacterium]MCH2530383.1 aldo/keto reductase [Dehalococcoidia bacterium]MDP6961349.1 aldo/keto reductase [Dehalococcoidia bacterium]MQF63711.1 aldo/keto reductase [SAR202 cluster bacterium AD-802-L14_MRT_200m]